MMPWWAWVMTAVGSVGLSTLVLSVAQGLNNLWDDRR